MNLTKNIKKLEKLTLVTNRQVFTVTTTEVFMLKTDRITIIESV
jgi:hypothetical protein